MTEPMDSIDKAIASLQVARNFGVQNQAEYDALKAKYDALVTPPTPKPPNPQPTNPSGQPMPTTDLDGWKLGWSEDFNKDAAPGKIRDVYGTKLGFYPPNAGTAYYPDTSKRGRYETDNLDATGSCLRYHVHTTPDGIHHVGAVIPKLSTLGQYGAVNGGRFSVRWRSAKLPTYKVAWLLWPNDGIWPKNGEIDFPECSLAGTETIKGFMHRQDATVGSDQDSVSSNALPTSWHTCTTEWIMGKSCKFYMDDALIKTVTARVPATPMRWTLQTETSLNKATVIDNAADGYVEIDWLAYWAPV